MARSCTSHSKTAHSGRHALRFIIENDKADCIL